MTPVKFRIGMVRQRSLREILSDREITLSHLNGEKISTKRELIDDISELDGSEVTLGISRKGESIPVSVTPVKDKKGDYKLGIWVRDDTQGIGTLTYVDQNGNYGALGHGISDIDTAQLLNIRNGALYKPGFLRLTKEVKAIPANLQDTSAMMTEIFLELSKQTAETEFMVSSQGLQMMRSLLKEKCRLRISRKCRLEQPQFSAVQMAR
mgnify:CR=1 FL=1